MTSSPLPPRNGAYTLIFGSQILDFNDASARELRAALLEGEDLRWIADTIEELPVYGRELEKNLPEIKVIRLLEELKEWFQTGKSPNAIFPLPNAVLTPLVVVTHLVQYLTFCKTWDPDADLRDGLQSAVQSASETLGLCTGLLSAVAVSSSENFKELQTYGATAIRLAMAIGAVADIEGDWTSLSVSWTSSALGDQMMELLKSFPETYVAVIAEEHRATVTTPSQDAASLEEQLKGLRLGVTKVGLRGNFHSPMHRERVEALLRVLDSHPAFRFPDASDMVVPTRSNTTGEYIRSGPLHKMVTESMLTLQSNWHQAFAQLDSVMDDQSLVILFGPERCVPPGLARRLGPRLLQGTANLELGSRKVPNSISQPRPPPPSDEAIAVIGMSCHLPGAPDLDRFWEILCAGKSQHKEVPAERFNFQTPWRDNDPSRKWYGNFIDDYDMFDHKFFKRSPREMASTDPQHRLMLQTAYHALEQAGYFQTPSDLHVGCYIGVGLVDYENNIACHPANAYSATGNLKAFAAGKISHYFGWTGPAQTIDTACSSSAVAVHQACKAILTGECSAAIAGGVNVMTSPEWFQNLAGASFLSPTGQCKPFDANSDGYCRAEGVGAVYLKRLSTAIENGDQILGVIASSAVYQNRNCTAITVPNTPSLSDLFCDVVSKAGLTPKQISVVEAHGTGTPVGDPVEYESVRNVLGGPAREGAGTISLGSVKGLLGHTESASGIVALIKTLLMILKGSIPPQASFQRINPAIQASPLDRIDILTKLKAWDAPFRAALINNYGASGSNASLVVTQAPSIPPVPNGLFSDNSQSAKYPFWVGGLDGRSLRANAARLASFLRASPSQNEDLTLRDLSFAVCHKSNRSLSHALIFSCKTVEELQSKLEGFAAESGTSTISVSDASASPRPVILAFGGQVSTFVGLDRQVYDEVKILRMHLDACDLVCKSLGVGSIYPEIFERQSIRDIVKLQIMLFATQYSCAKSWIDCGVSVTAVLGHSFGELTAMCVAGVLTLRDALTMIAGRARLIRDYWGDEKGAMVAVEADLRDVERLVSLQSSAEEGFTVDIACFNGPRGFTLAGSVKAIGKLQEIAIGSPEFSSSIKLKRLDVTNAFHSTLVEPLMTKLEQLGQHLVFHEPQIHIETATKYQSVASFTPAWVASHMRNPVYFHEAVQRLSEQYPGAIWLEAGSNSTVTTMAGKALGFPKSTYLQAINITSSRAFESLTEATVSLWRQGLSTKFWAHHMKQTSDYIPILLPPYQFEKARHWIELERPVKMLEAVQPQPQVPDVPTALFIFEGYQDASKRKVRFRVNTTSERYQTYVAAHKIARSAPICPSTFQLVITIEALLSLVPESEKSNYIPELRGMTSHTPLCMNDSLSVWLHAEGDRSSWEWKMSSTSSGALKSEETLHVSGGLVFRSINDAAYLNDFAKYERLVKRQQCSDLLSGTVADQVIKGSRNIYRAFADIVQYDHEIYRGLQALAGSGNQSAGHVVKKHSGDTWLDLGLADSFCQVAGIYLNSMTERADGEMYISDNIHQWIRSPRAPSGLLSDSGVDSWDVFASHHTVSEKEHICDVFAFDQNTGMLVEVILGIHYVRVSRNGLGKLLSRLETGSSTSLPRLDTVPAKVPLTNGTDHTAPHPAPQGLVYEPDTTIKSESNEPSRPKITEQLQELICNLSGLEPDQVKANANLADLGIDSLMGMELAREVEAMFKCTLEMSALLELTDFQSLVDCIHKVLGGSGVERQPGINGDKELVFESNGTNGHHANGVSQANGTSGHTNGINGVSGANSAARFPEAVILQAFMDTKRATDTFIEENLLANYRNDVIPVLDELCVVHILDAFDELGASLRSAQPGQTLPLISYPPRHEQFVTFIYELLERFGLLIRDGSLSTRTTMPCPTQSASTLKEQLIRNFPDHIYDHQLTYLAGSRLADCLTGNLDGVQLIFGSDEGREYASGMYGKSPINVAWIAQMKYFLKQLFNSLPESCGPIKILEMGAGTGGTTASLLPILADLNIPIEYTVTDLSASLVARARKRFKQYPFMHYRVLDIEAAPPTELVQSQHIVIATNCVHATHNLVTSTSNIHQLLRPDGFLMMLEMTETLAWIDLVFGMLEGWWLFNDGRRHALVPPAIWERTLKSVGYGHVEWTNGNLPESAIQRIIIALASYSSEKIEVHHSPSLAERLSTDWAARKVIVDGYVTKYTDGFLAPVSLPPSSSITVTADNGAPIGRCILVTGSTGSLGSHLVAHFASLPTVDRVVCVNRYSSLDPELRQHQALESRGLNLPASVLSKLEVFQTDTSKPLLGFSTSEYTKLVDSITDIIHNAWPMSITRPIQTFEPQFRTMRNLIDLARDVSEHRPWKRVGCQFISSVATVGHYPLWSGHSQVPEARMEVDSVLPTGYGDAKLVCERMLERTLQRQADRFHAMIVRIGQIAGSKISGYWNPVEHLAFLLKSSQSIQLLPDLSGTLSWCPVDDAAATLGEILLSNSPRYPIYHVENPARQPWDKMTPILADALGIPRTNIVPFARWLEHVRGFSGPIEENPVKNLVDFLERDFTRMDCGGLVLDTTRSRQHSSTLRELAPIKETLVHKYIMSWRERGFLI